MSDRRILFHIKAIAANQPLGCGLREQVRILTGESRVAALGADERHRGRDL